LPEAHSPQLKKFGEVHGTLALIFSVGLENDTLDLLDQPFGSSLRRTQLLDELL
jgi:hypothetical protein